MNNRKQLESDLQNYKNKYQELQRNQEVQQALSKKLLNDSKDIVIAESKEFQQSLSNNIKTIEKLNIDIKEVQSQISAVEFILKNRKDHIADFLKHINDENEGLPLHFNEIQFQKKIKKPQQFDTNISNLNNDSVKDFTINAIDQYYLLEMSEVITRVALSKKGIKNKIIENKNAGNTIIYNSDGSITYLVWLGIHDITNESTMDNPDVILVSEFSISKNENNKPYIKLISDKAILCHKAAKYFDNADVMLFEEKYSSSMNDIYETLQHDAILKLIVNYVNCMDVTPDLDIIANDEILELVQIYFIITSNNHSNWLLLHETLNTYVNKLSSNKDLERNTAITKFVEIQGQEKTHTRMFFYKEAQNCLIKAFQANTLTRSMGIIKEYYIKNNPSPIQFIQFSQNEVVQRDSWDRKQETKDLYKAIVDIKFEKNKQGYINVSCLKNLEKAVERYINPPKDKIQLEQDLLQYVHEYEKYDDEVARLEAPINEVKSFLQEMAIGEHGRITPGIMIQYMLNNKHILLNLDKCIEEKQIFLKIDHNKNVMVNLEKRQVTLVSQHDLTLEYDAERMIFDTKNGRMTLALKEKNTDEVVKTINESFEIFETNYYLPLTNQKITYIVNPHEVSVIFENLASYSNDILIENQQLVLMIENQKVLLNFKNQPSKLELNQFIKNFNDKTVTHVFKNKNMVPINKVIGNIKGFLNKINDQRINSFVNLFTPEKINEILDAFSLMLVQLNMVRELDFSSNAISQALYIIKPQLEKLKKHVYSFVEWYNDNVDDSVKFTVMKMFVNTVIDQIINKCDSSQIISLQNSIDDKLQVMADINAKQSAIKHTLKLLTNSRRKNMEVILYHLNNGKNGLPNEHYAHWNVKELSPLRNSMKGVINFNCLVDISEIAAQLVLSRNNIVNKNFKPYQDGLNVIDYENGCFTVIVKNSMQDIKSMNMPEAIIVTEFYIGQGIIELVSDKIILCHTNAENVFSKDDALIEENYDVDLRDINKTLHNDFMLKSIKKHIVCMDISPDESIKQILTLFSQYALMSSISQEDWFILWNTLAPFVEKLKDVDTSINIKDDVTINRIYKILDSMSFYQNAQKSIIQLFQHFMPNTLTEILEEMRKYYIDNQPSPLVFIQHCQYVIDQRGFSFIKPQLPENVYNAITALKYDKTKDLSINNKCIINLEKAIVEYQRSIVKVTQTKGTMFGGSSNLLPTISENKQDKKQNYNFK